MLKIDDILGISDDEEFRCAAMEVFRRQAAQCPPYRGYLDAIGISPGSVTDIGEIPYLPIELFKTHKVYCGDNIPEAIFISSGTGGESASRHYVARLSDYEKIYTRDFELFYGTPADWSIYALLPSYLEREGSSLVYMAEGLMRQSGTYGRESRGGFYLYDHDKLLTDMAADSDKKMLLGVSYALLDLAEMLAKMGEKLPGAETGKTIVVETGGMKGRREEMTKRRMHSVLRDTFGVEKIHSEYGMAELMSQAWSSGEGVFRTPPWMKVAVRDLTDPFDVSGIGARWDGNGGKTLRGGVNIIDLANLDSCAFIQTQDLGTLSPDGGFTIDGRVARSDIRGCNLLVQ